MGNKKALVGEKIRTLRKAAGLTQIDLAERAELTSGQISFLETGERPIFQDSFSKVLNALGVSELEFFTDGLNTTSAPELIHSPIPVISSVSAGEFFEAADPWPVGVSGEGDPVYSDVRTGPHTFGLIVEGESMLPRFLPGDVVIVDPDIPTHNGCACVAWINGDVSLKMFYETEKEITLKPLNPKYPVVLIPKDSEIEFRVIGKVVDLKAKL